MSPGDLTIIRNHRDLIDRVSIPLLSEPRRNSSDRIVPVVGECLRSHFALVLEKYSFPSVPGDMYNDWSRILCPGGTGWISQRYLERVRSNETG